MFSDVTEPPTENKKRGGSWRGHAGDRGIAENFQRFGQAEQFFNDFLIFLHKKAAFL
jgi:hypothetical protein